MGFKRAFALIIDFTPYYVLFFIAILNIEKIELSDHMPIILVFAFSQFPYFLLKDLVFRNKSLGKLIMRICIVDKKTKGLPKVSSLIVRNISVFIFEFDALVWLVKRESIGDLISDTTVINISEFRGT